MEKLLHYVWKHKLFPLSSLRTTAGEDMEVIDPGMHNSSQGPDFFNAKVRVGGTLWAGNVEVHLKSSDWYRHGHETDPFYNNTILHVVEKADCEIETEDGKHPTQLELPIPAHLLLHYEELLRTDDYPRCHKLIPSLSPIQVHGWMDALLAERLTERSNLVLQRVKETNGNWEQATFATLCRNFGFGLNGDVFENWGKRIPLQSVAKHRDNLFQIEAIFLGLAGLLEADNKRENSDEIAHLKQEFTYLSHKFNLPEPMSSDRWKYLRTRPQNFPHVRIRQLAKLYHAGTAQTSILLETENVEDLHQCLEPSEISASSKNLIIINTVVPLLYAYGESHQEPILQERAIRILEQLKAENNYILRQWKACGLNVETAADSQALIQLKREYCDKLDCLRCRFGYEYLKQK